MTFYSLKKDHFKEFAAFLFLVTVVIFTDYNLEGRIDIELSDEAYYMYQGVTFFAEGIASDWGPLYSLWYKVLSYFEHERVSLYYLNMALLSSLPTFAIYVFLRFFECGAVVALFFAALFHFSIINFPQGVKVSMFALVFLIAGTLLIYKYAKSNLSLSLSLVAVLMFVCAYVRPENTLTWGLAVIVNLGLIVYRKKPSVYLILSGVFILLLVVFIGNPISQRSELAFKRQFGYHYIMRHPDDLRFQNLDVWIDFDEVTMLIFGQDVTSFYEAFLLRGSFIFDEHFIPNAYTFSGMLYDLLKRFPLNI